VAIPPLNIAATGHRWERLGVKRAFWVDDRLECVAHSFLQQLRPDVAISGLALGWDQAFARAALMLEIPLVAAVPLGIDAQTVNWKFSDRYEHGRILQRCTHVEIVGEGYAFARACDLRNRWMVDRAHLVAAMWSGQPSGTANAVRYAEQRDVPVVNLWGLQHR